MMILSLRTGEGIDGLQHVLVDSGFRRTGLVTGTTQAGNRNALRRPGQTKRVRAYFCTTDHGSDPVMLETLDVKSMQSQGLIEGGADGAAQPPPEKMTPERYTADQTTGLPRRGASRSGIDSEEDRMSTEPLPPLGSPQRRRAAHIGAPVRDRRRHVGVGMARGRSRGNGTAASRGVTTRSPNLLMLRCFRSAVPAAILCASWSVYLWQPLAAERLRCERCSWVVALNRGTVEQEIDLYGTAESGDAPSGDLLRHIFTAILADAPPGHEAEAGHRSDLLAHAARHRPGDHACAKRAPRRAARRLTGRIWRSAPRPRCCAKSARSRGIGGLASGMASATGECVVAAPCSVLTALAVHYDIPLTGWEGRR